MSGPRKSIKARDAAFYLLFIVMLLCIKSSVFASYHVPTGSMRPTILEGDFFFANKLAYRLKLPFTGITLINWQTPDRGDIIVLKQPGSENPILTKRVIGVPGDVLEIRNKYVILNGEKIETVLKDTDGGYSVYEEHLPGSSHLVQHLSYRTSLDNMKKVTIPEGFLFVMGDNRDSSLDSRSWGLVPFENIEGELVVRWFSIDPVSHRPRFDRVGPL